MVCGDAFESYPQMILDGDRNIGTATAQSTTADNTNSTVKNATVSMGNWRHCSRKSMRVG